MAIGGGLGWMKWLKNGAEKGFISHAIILPYILFGENSMLESQSSKNKTVTRYEGWKDGGICQIFFTVTTSQV